ncbi:MAG: muconolactone Delta-isomerase family protein [Saprospiraceae bacterium]
MDNTGLKQYMVVFTLPPQPFNDLFLSLIPDQRQVVNKLLQEGKILNYALSLENSKLWAVFSVESETELLELITSLPLTDFMLVHINELTFFQAATAFTSSFSVN